MPSINRKKFADAVIVVGISVGAAGVAAGSVYIAVAGPIMWTIAQLIKQSGQGNIQNEVQVVRQLREQTRRALKAHGLPYTDADIAVFLEAIIEYAQHDKPYEAMGEYLEKMLKK